MSMKATSLIYRKLSQADFKNISGQGGVEGGGGQGYIDISANAVSPEQMLSFLRIKMESVRKVMSRLTWYRQNSTPRTITSRFCERSTRNTKT